jgi:hypothetical protein
MSYDRNEPLETASWPTKQSNEQSNEIRPEQPCEKWIAAHRASWLTPGWKSGAGPIRPAIIAAPATATGGHGRD